MNRENGKIIDESTHHSALLTKYGFRHLEEFDLPIVEGGERGFFDTAAVKRQADELQKSYFWGIK